MGTYITKIYNSKTNKAACILTSNNFLDKVIEAIKETNSDCKIIPNSYNTIPVEVLPEGIRQKAEELIEFYNKDM